MQYSMTGIAMLAIACGCSAPGSLSTPTDGNAAVAQDAPSDGDPSMTPSDAGGTMDDGGGNQGGAITCPDPGMPKHNGGSCGSERWNIKVGTDSQASGISLVPHPNTIAALAALPANGGGTHRTAPTETTLWELKDVTLTELKLESDSDYHLVISDGSTHTMIAEIPYPSCATSSPWLCFESHARSVIDAKYTVTSSPIYPAMVITLRGVGFFDVPHGQTGVAPNAIELHPVLQLCFGHGCTPT